MIRSVILVSIITFSSVACSQNEIPAKEKDQQNLKEASSVELSAYDKKIIEKYEQLQKSFRTLVQEDFVIKQKEFLPEVLKIKDKKTREKLQMQIYTATGMYKEAYDLNEKLLKESFSTARLVTKCELSYYAQIPKQEIEACYTELAAIVQKKLKTTPKNDPQYIYGEWGYLLFMYKSGHDEYKQKMENFIRSTKDETDKYQFQNSYEMAIETHN
ncbi:hypothetical protein [Acinetobacter sp.]|uniref:hypothetical protein n=1 Tax=Acinetobacter sp. TaxID=472 RepID=UPI0035B39C0A